MGRLGHTAAQVAGEQISAQIHSFSSVASTTVDAFMKGRALSADRIANAPVKSGCFYCEEGHSIDIQ